MSFQYPHNPSAPVAGWYPDPAGSGAMRWWDGYRWTQQLAPRTAPAPAPPRALPSDVPVGTWAFWVIVLLPLVSIVSTGLEASGIAGTVMQPQWHADGSLSFGSSPFSLLGPNFLIATVIGWATYAATVVLAYFDWRILGRRGLDRPFHWAWAFIPGVGGILYVIGRLVIVWRRAHRGLAPLWVYIATTVVSWIVSGIFVTVMLNRLFSTVFATLPNDPSFYS